MKKFYISIVLSVIVSSLSYGQNPNIFQEWILHSIEEEGQEPILFDPLEPFATFTPSENQEFSAETQCNYTDGKVNFLDDEEGEISFFEFGTTLNSCNDPELDDWDWKFTNMFQTAEIFEYREDVWENNQFVNALFITTEDNIVYSFRESTLHTTDLSKSLIRVYPNPTSDYLKIENAKINSEYQILSLDGKLVQAGKINANSQLNVSNLAKGIYVLKVNNQVLKFLKK